MNNWLNRLERKYGRYGIPNLTNILVAGQILVLAIELFVDRTIPYWLGLSRSLLLQGQIWRVISFIFIPFSGGSILSVVLGIYFTWFVGTALEREWGDFRYTVYLLSGVLGTVLGCLLTGVTASTYCLSLSLLLAFAMLYPEVQLLLFFVIPIRVKYFGIFAAVLWVFSFLGASLPGKLDYLLSMLNVWLFFAPMAYRSLRAWVRREQWKRKNRRKILPRSVLALSVKPCRACQLSQRESPWHSGKVSGFARASPFEERLPPLRGKMSRSDKRGSVARRKP